MVGPWQYELEDDEIKDFETISVKIKDKVTTLDNKSFLSSLCYLQDPFMKNRGETKMSSVAEELFETITALGKEIRRRFNNTAETPKDYDKKELKDKIIDASCRLGYCLGLKHVLMLLEQLNVPVEVPDDKLLPDIPKEKKPVEPTGIIPTVDELETKTDYEGDYVVVKGDKYYAEDIIRLISEASILDSDLTQQGKRMNTKIAEARSKFPGMTDDQIMGMDFRGLSKEQRNARSYIRDYRAKKESQAKTKAALLSAEKEDLKEGEE